MGQHLLILILGVCIFGMAISLGVIKIQENLQVDNRDALTAEMYVLAERAQQYVTKPSEEGGGGGSFREILKDVRGIRRLTSAPSSVHGEYFVRGGGRYNSITLVGIGVRPGWDTALPVRVQMTVWADSVALSVLN